MESNHHKVVRLVNREGIHIQSKKEYCISNGFEKLGSVRKVEEVDRYKKLGIVMIDLGNKVVFYSINDSRFKV